MLWKNLFYFKVGFVNGWDYIILKIQNNQFAVIQCFKGLIKKFKDTIEADRNHQVRRYTRLWLTKWNESQTLFKTVHTALHFKLMWECHKPNNNKGFATPVPLSLRMVFSTRILMSIFTCVAEGRSRSSNRLTLSVRPQYVVH